MNKQNNISEEKIIQLTNRTHDALMKRFGVDLKAILNKPNSMAEKLRDVKKQALQNYAKRGFDIHKFSDSVSSPMSGCEPVPIIFGDKAFASNLASLSGNPVEAAIKFAEAQLKIIEVDEADYTTLKEELFGIGVFGIGGLWVTGAAAVYYAMATAFATGGAAAATTAAAGLGVTSTTGVSAIISGLGLGTSAGTASAMWCSLAAFAVSGPGLIIVGIALVAAAAALITWMNNRPRSIAGLIVNMTPNELKLAGGGATSNGVYSIGNGVMSYFPGIFENNDEPDLLEYYGVPAPYLPIESVDDFMYGIGFFAFESTSGDATGYFSMSYASNSYLVFLISNPSGAHSTGCYISNDPLTDTAANIYDKYEALKTTKLTTTGGPSYTWNLTANTDSKWGADSYMIFSMVSNII
jgi:uncharacterized membrane protein